MAIGRILIANRGEIAVRIVRTCRELGLEPVLAVSDADRESLGAKLATRAVCIGPARSSHSYLNIGAVIEAALRTGCPSSNAVEKLAHAESQAASRVTTGSEESFSPETSSRR